MEKQKIIYKSKNVEIPLLLDRDNNTVWLSRQGMSVLFGKHSKTIDHHLLINQQEGGLKNSQLVSKFETNKDKGKQTIIVYDLETVKQIANRLNKIKAFEEFELWANNQLKDYKIDRLEPNYIDKINNKYEIMAFSDNGFVLDVNVSPLEETVWLTLDQIAILFDRDKSVISKHITKIYEEKELDEISTVAKNATLAMNGKNYQMEYYNLDLILSVGYRVNSKRGIAFRRWASSVLKQYLLKGYSVNENRLKEVEQSQLLFADRIIELENDMKLVKDSLFSDRYPIIIHKGKGYDAFSFLSSIIASANKSIYLIDPYADLSALDLLSKKDASVKVTLIYKNEIPTTDLDSFINQYGEIKTIKDSSIHDRYIIIDEHNCYEIGTSINSLGKNESHINKNNKKEFIIELLAKYK